MLLRRIVREKKDSLFCVRRYAEKASPHLRAQPWAFNDNTAAFQKTQHRTTTARYNFDMAAKADGLQFHGCFALAAEMKQKGITPTILTYNTLLRALGHGGYGPQAFAVFEDMLSFGVSPDATSFNHLIHVIAMYSGHQFASNHLPLGPPNRDNSNSPCNFAENG